MDSTAGGVAWPALARPLVDSAGCFTQGDRGFANDYTNGMLSIHVFAYAARMRIGEAVVDILPDDLTLTPPGAHQAFDIPRPGVHWCIRAAPDPRRVAGESLHLPCHLRLGRRLAIEARARMRYVIDDFARCDGSPAHPAARAASAGTQALLCWLATLGLAAEPAGRVPAALRKAEELLGNPDSARLPIATLARRCGLSQNRLARAFRQRHGLSMAQYRSRALIAFAQQWMASTPLPLEAIARQIGIRDPHHFNKLFRRVAGTSPSRWRADRRAVATSVARPDLGIDPPAWSGGRPPVDQLDGAGPD